MTTGFATEAIAREVLSRFVVVFAFASLALAILVAFALLVRLCSTIVEEHRPDLRVDFQVVRAQVAMVLY